RTTIKHWQACIAVLGCPAMIKTDNGPNYTSRKTVAFCQLWQIQLVHGIPYNSTGQAIVERAHQT
ncbi:POK18 protein, partial [Nyctiprogne leucopyga]|nr:POK18 protein [Nyctiprogne leucopyga]